MKKLFTILAAALFSVSMMAETMWVSFNGADDQNVTGFYTFSGKHNFNNKFTGASYAGIDFTSGLKMEGTTTVNFTTTKVSTVIVVQSTSAGSDKTIKFDGEALANGVEETGYKIYTVSNVAAGNHSVTRGSGEAGLFYISVEYSEDPTKATVKNITIDGEDLEGFDAATLAYDVELPYSYEGLPVVDATTGDGATVAIAQVAELPGTATVVCTSKDESTSVTYTINFTKKATGNSDATLKDLQLNGTTVAGFAADKYEYNVELGYYDAVNVVATPNDENVLAILISDNETDQVTIDVTAENGETSLLYVINYTHKERTELVSISESTTWDWKKAGDKTAAMDATTLPSNNEEFNFADVLTNYDAEFKANALIGKGQYANNGFAQCHLIKFNTTVPGNIVVEFSNTGKSERPDRVLLVNEVPTEYKSKTSASNVTTGSIAVNAGDVVLEALEMKETPEKNMIRVYKIVFTKSGTTAVENAEAAVKAVKVVENGQLVIIKNGVKYNAQGAIVK